MTPLEQAKAEAIEAFRAAGLLPNEIVADGMIHRCAVFGGKAGALDGSYKIHPDAPFSWWYENHKTGAKSSGCLKPVNNTPLSKAAREAFKRQQEANRRARAKQDEAKHTATAERARRIYEKATDCSGHSYLSEKKVSPCSGLKLSASPFKIGGISFPASSLIGPIYDPAALFPGSGKNPGGASDEPVNLQFINETGDKRYLPGGKKQGCAFVIGGGADRHDDDPVIVCEGLATGLTLREATGSGVCVAFDAGNLRAAAEIIRRKYPERLILLAADDDWRTEGNPGLSKATAAARAVGGFVAIPVFGLDRGAKDTDFNDMAARHGLGAVRARIKAATKEGPPLANEAAQPTKEMTMYADNNSQSGVVSQGAKPLQPIDDDYLAALMESSDKSGIPSRRKPPETENVESARIRSVSLHDFLSLEFPPRENLLDPWLPSQGLIMVYAYRGVGKTHFALGVARAVAYGSDFLTWRAPKPAGVLYIDGEMPAVVMQERLAAIVASTEQEMEAPFELLNQDLLPRGVGIPRIDTQDGQQAIDEILTANPEIKLVVVDNVSTLTGAKENEADGWLPVQAWALRQRAAGRSVLLVHHAGKGGGQRGTSRREDVLDTVLALRRPVDYQPDQGAVFEIHFEKARGIYGDDVTPIEARLTSDENGATVWATRTVEAGTYDRVVQMLNDGMTQREIAVELGINKSTVSRHAKRAKDEGEWSEKS